MVRVFRAMLPSDIGEGPRIGRDAKSLGVRVHDPMHPQVKADVHPDESGMVNPGEGMSVAPTLEDLPSHRIPKRLHPTIPKATGRDNNVLIWRYGDGPWADGGLADGLALKIDSSEHGVVEPVQSMHLSSYESALAATQPDWINAEENP